MNELELHTSTGINLSIMLSEESKLQNVHTEWYYFCKVLHIVKGWAHM